MLCLCASPQLMHHAECLALVASGTILFTYSPPSPTLFIPISCITNGHSRTAIPPIDPPMTTATPLTPSTSNTAFCSLTSSLTVVGGNSGPYLLPVPELTVTGDAVPYGDPNTLAQKMKNRPASKAFPLPISGPHQSSTSALPVKA